MERAGLRGAGGAGVGRRGAGIDGGFQREERGANRIPEIARRERRLEKRVKKVPRAQAERLHQRGEAIGVHDREQGDAVGLEGLRGERLARGPEGHAKKSGARYRPAEMGVHKYRLTFPA